MSYSLYVHIPYCRSRCQYCDFYTTAAAGVPEAYVQALLRQFDAMAPKDEQGAPLPPGTVYFGGGTPSLLAPGQVERLLAVFGPAPGAEVTLEANPDSAAPQSLAAWRRAGVNRLSLGVQSARDESLRALGRRHTAAGAREALRNARKAGFDTISGDIMLALPGYTREEFDETLQLLAEEGAAHISAYLLKIEQDTPFGRKPPAGLPDTEEAADFYLYAAERLERAGYAQYEISNFARPGRAGRHNLVYWNCEDYLGLGPAAHSCMEKQRFSVPPDAAAYIAGGALPRAEGECTAEDYIMLRLRLAEGLRQDELQRRWGVRLTQRQAALLDKLAAGGLARRTEDGWALTPRGMLVQNSVLAQLLAE